jgi:ABC-type transport system substrate-binding protein
MKGKRIPQIGKVIVQVILEDQSRLLAFQKDETDLFQLYGGLAPQVLQDGKLKPEFASKGVQLSRIISPELTIYYWNMQDPVLGGLSKEKIALRRAVRWRIRSKRKFVSSITARQFRCSFRYRRVWSDTIRNIKAVFSTTLPQPTPC